MRRPASNSNFPPEGHVRLTANLPRELHASMKVRAASTGTSMTDLLVKWIKQGLEKAA